MGFYSSKDIRGAKLKRGHAYTIAMRAKLCETTTPEHAEELLQQWGYSYTKAFTKTVKCGARCRDGHACRAPARPNGKCRCHGGCSTGPRTEEGRRQISEAQKRRWAKVRQDHE